MKRLAMKREFHVTRGRRSRLAIESGPASEPPPLGTIPRISRLLALAIRFDRLIKDGEVADQAEIARLGHVTRARVTQIMNLLYLAPDIQEALLFLPRTTKGHDPIREKHVRPIAGEPDWQRQRRLWKSLSVDKQAQP